ncbi:hypothetical protein B296_00038417 [Ensete ventricosum]|uniref:Uncharacterized protein n=1 Tax=Ensete ventricosum TaxID=4639 RepID=A0A426YZ10_ENSVE|nr:hypothetical protein B296_00038417 [Ensete ventricosum]
MCLPFFKDMGCCIWKIEANADRTYRTNTWLVDSTDCGSSSVWDIRTKAMVMALSGHENTVCSVFARPTVRKSIFLWKT